MINAISINVVYSYNTNLKCKNENKNKMKIKIDILRFSIWFPLLEPLHFHNLFGNAGSKFFVYFAFYYNISIAFKVFDLNFVCVICYKVEPYPISIVFFLNQIIDIYRNVYSLKLWVYFRLIKKTTWHNCIEIDPFSINTIIDILKIDNHFLKFVNSYR